jgi:CBS domain-containing protein
MRIKEIMNRAIVVDESIKLKEATKIMSGRRIGSLVVTKKNEIVGVVTERDVLKNVNKLDSKLSTIMSKNVITVDESESLDNAALLMSKHKIKRLPVLREGKLAGIVTATDVLANSGELNVDFFFD